MSAPAIISSGTAAGGPPVGGTGTTNTIPRWTGVSTLGDSLITQTLAGAPFEATRIRVATGVDTYAWFRDSAPSGNVLFVAANAAFGAYKGLEIASAGTYFTVGNVGIGTTSPGARLHVTQGASGSFANLLIGSAGTSTNFYDANEHYWRNGTLATGMYMNASGNVGIGTTSPASRLDVAGTITCDDAGTGLKLPATPGNGDTQTLDCYAEGTWTPTLAGFVTNTPGSIAASYTRVGRMVTLNVYLYAGGSSFGSTLGTTTVTVPSGMTPNFDGVGIGGLSRTASSTAQAIAYYDGKIYLGTSASVATEMWVSVTYYV